jgi:lipopolysaccharide transport system ATP-binding protein
MGVILQAENISKQYRLGTVGTGSLAHDFNRWWHTVRGKEDPYLKIGEVNERGSKATSDYVWALQDINFEVQPGEVLGIIGKNGAGKSTLLKLLSRVTAPTTGAIRTRGRIASLLEVGTGFHGELTGRENIYMNGAILGMTKKEITAKLDEIIAFSGCERYIDTPVKRYSSGMTVRLGFAVAAHLEPDILVVDEVLAVGDAEFQKKAIGKMQDISKTDGRTVLFVSHNMAAVKSLCTRGLVLENGMKVFEGTAKESVGFYLGGDQNLVNKKIFKPKEMSNEFFELYQISVQKAEHPETEIIDEYDEIEIVTHVSFLKDTERLHLTYVLNNEEGEALFTFSHHHSFTLQKGLNKLVCRFPKGFLNIGTYFLSFFIIQDKKRSVFVEKDIICFQVTHGERGLGAWMGKEPGFIKPKFEWLNC